MNIRKALFSDLEKIEKIYFDARAFMKRSGNPEQWKSGHPCREIVVSDIENGDLFVCEGDTGIMGVFFFKFADDPTYERIYDGKWRNSIPYGVIHRIAVAENAHGCGVARACFNFGYELCGNLKIDTHKDNIPMQKALLKNGFDRCGIIYLANGEERIAFQKI